MKKLLIFSLALAIGSSLFGQKKGEEITDPWFEVYTRAPFQQGREGTILLEIQNTGVDVADCIAKAKQQAIFAVIFTGYTEANNIPAAAALSPTDVALYQEKIDFFKPFLSTPAQYGVYVPTADLNPKKPVSKIDKRTVEAHVIVTVEVDRLRKQLEAQNIIKSMMDFGFKPSIIVVPSDEWMRGHGYVTTKDNQGITEEIFNYSAAITDGKISKALDALNNKFGGPNGAFEVQDIAAKLNDIKLEEQKNNARNDAKKESALDIFARVLEADLWIKLDLTENELEKGLKTQFLITLYATDPYTGNKVISGKTISKETTGDNKFQLMINSMNGAADDFRPQVMAYFKGLVDKGIQGKLTVSLNEDVEFNFNQEFEYKENQVELNRILDNIVKKKSITYKEVGTQTENVRTYSANIPLETTDMDGEKEPNNFKKFAYQITGELKKLGMTYKVEPSGLGKVEIIITGTKN